MKQTEDLFQRQAVQYRRFFETRPSCLVDAVTDQTKFADAMRIGVNSDLNSGLAGGACVFGRQVQAVRARINFKETSATAGVIDNTLNVDFITGPLQQQPTRSVSKDIEIAIVHRPHNTIRLLLFAEREARMNR